jgi:hypothetical protein
MMRRTGTVAAINPWQGRVAIWTEDDGYTIIELLSDFGLDVGDKMAWSGGYGLGSEIYENLTKGTTIEVFVKDHAVSRSNFRQQLLL